MRRGYRPRRMPTAHLGDQLVHWRAASDARILYVHGVPNHGAMWAPFLAASGGVAVDLPGFGASGKRGDADYSFESLGRFVAAFLDHLGWDDDVRLCLHDWGAVGLLAARDRPERIARVALIDAVPFLPGYHWHLIARLWRRRVVGELAMGFTNGFTARRLGLPAELVDETLAGFDEGTQRAILRLYRSADEDLLARAGEDLGRLECPALVVWGERDRYVPASFAHAYAAALPGAREATLVPGAGHWPWLDAPDVVRDVTDFLTR
jgi:pimeloyl-ACP methyl ester carboxylesterase